MAQLHETIMGQRFFQRDLPALVKAVNRVADALEKREEAAPKTDDKQDENGRKLWFRAGVSVNLSAEEYAEVIKGTETGAKILQAKIQAGTFALDGNSYIPIHSEDEEPRWPVEEEVDYEF